MYVNQDKNKILYSLVGAILLQPMVKIATINKLLHAFLGIPSSSDFTGLGSNRLLAPVYVLP